MATFRHKLSGPLPSGDVWNCTLHSTSSQTLASVHLAFGTFVQNLMNNTVKPLWPTAMSCTGIETDQLDPITGKNLGQELSAVSYVGTGAGAVLPQRATVVIGLRTTLPTRAGRGRFSLPAPDATHLSNEGGLAAATATALATGVATVINGMSGTATIGIYSRKEKTVTPVIAVTVGQVFGSQRRRTNKVPEDYAQADV